MVGWVIIAVMYALCSWFSSSLLSFFPCRPNAGAAGNFFDATDSEKCARNGADISSLVAERAAKAYGTSYRPPPLPGPRTVRRWLRPRHVSQYCKAVIFFAALFSGASLHLVERSSAPLSLVVKPPPFQIMVNLPLGTTAVFNGVTELKKLGMINVTELKKFAADRDRCNPKDLYATYMGKLLEDTWTLEKCNLQMGSMVNVSLRMPGGGFTTRKRATPPAPTLEPPPAAPAPAAPAAPAAAPVAGPALASAPLAPDAAVAARRAAKRRQGGAADDDAEVSLGRVLHSAGEGALGAWLEAKKRVVHCLNVGSGMVHCLSPLPVSTARSTKPC